MKLHRDIEMLDIIINDFKKDLSYSNNKNILYKRINKLIDVRNNYNSMLRNEFYFDSLDTLILSNILLKIQLNNLDKPNYNDISIFFKDVFKDLHYGRDYKFAEIEGRIITGLQLKYIDSCEKEKLLKVYPKNKINESIVKLLEKFKSEMVWKISQK